MAYSHLFVDSDVLLDILLEREPFYPFGQQLLMTGLKGTVKLSTSALVIANIHYILAKNLGKDDARQKLKLLLKFLNVYPFTAEAIELALNSKFNDLEDAFQYFTALKNQCNLIISRNTKHYTKSQLPVLTAEQFLKQYAN